MIAMRVADVMTTRPVTVGPHTTVGAALRLLAEHRITSLPVVDRSFRIVGVASEADLIRERIEPETGAGKLVEDVMTRSSVVVHPGTDLWEAARVFARTSVKSLPVVDASDQVVGVVSRSDVVRTLARDDDTLEQDICDTLAAAGLSSYQVKVRNGVAQLHAGEGRDRPDVLRAIDLVAATPGVKAVHAW